VRLTGQQMMLTPPRYLFSPVLYPGVSVCPIVCFAFSTGFLGFDDCLLCSYYRSHILFSKFLITCAFSKKKDRLLALTLMSVVIIGYKVIFLYTWCILINFFDAN
jgi:hypothetical protein